MTKRKISILSIVLYVLSGILALYLIWAIVSIHADIAKQQVPFTGNEFAIINYYMANAGQYGIFAIVLFSLGWFFQRFAPAAEKADPVLMDPAAYAQEGIFAQEAKEIAESENDTAAMPTAEQDALSTEEVK